jgi:hypothetical protein
MFIDWVASLIFMNSERLLMMQYPASSIKGVYEEKKQIVKNLYLSNISEEFIAMQVDLEIPLVISILKELDVYKGGQR